MMRRGGWNFPGFPGEDYPPPDFITVAGKEVRAGSRVRLHPNKGRADPFDMLLDGKVGTIEVIHQDLENRIYLVVTADDDPALEQMRTDKRVFPGHLFYFFPEEVEPLDEEPVETVAHESQGGEGTDGRDFQWGEPWKTP